MSHKVTQAVVAAGLLLLCGNAAVAEPMLCSGEQQACISSCAKLTDATRQKTCITICGQRQAVCRNTGCWNNGATIYCGLGRR